MEQTTPILAIFGVLIAIVVVIAATSARYRRPEYYEEVLTKALSLQAAGQHREEIRILEGATERLARRKSLEPELAIRLARLRLALGRALIADEQSSAAALTLRETLNTAHAEGTVMDAAVVALFAERLATAVDVGHLRGYLDRATNPLSSSDPLPAALYPEFFNGLLDNGNTRQAAESLLEALYFRGVRIPWLTRLHGHALAEKGNTDAAVRIFHELTAGVSSERGDRQMLGRLLAKQKKFQDAFDIQKLLANEKQSTTEDCTAAGQTGLAIYDASKKKSQTLLDDCVRWLVRSTKLDTGNADAWGFLGRAHQLRGNRDQARDAYERAAGCGVDGAPKRLRIAEALLEMEMPAAALPHLRRAAELTSEDAGLWMRAGKLAFDLGNNNAAIADLERAAKCKGAPAEARLLLADAHAKAEHHERVVEILTAQKQLPDASLLTLARSLSRIDRNADAVDRLLMYVNSHAGDEGVRRELAMLYGRLAQWEQSAAQFAALKDPATLEKALPYAAYVNLRAGKLDVAARLLQVADGSGPDAVLVQHVAASLAARRGDASAAAAAWERALQRDANFPAALHAYAHFCENQREYAKALKLFTALHETRPDAALIVRIGVCHTRAGSYEMAITAFTASGDAANTDIEALECLAYCHAKQKNWEAAAQVLERLPKTGLVTAAKQRNELLVRYELARSFYEQRAYKEARQELQKLPAHHLSQSSVVRALYAAQLGCVSVLLPPHGVDGLTQLRSELDHLQRITPASFAARVLPALLELTSTGAAPKWSGIAEVKPTNTAQKVALAVLAAAAGEFDTVQHLLEGNTHASADLLRGVAALRAQQWHIAFDSLQAGLRNGLSDCTDTGTLLRMAAACGASAGRTDDVRALLEHYTADTEALRILGVISAAEGRFDESTLFLSSAGIAGAGTEGARRSLIWQSLQKMIRSHDAVGAAQLLATAPDELRGHPSFAAAELEVHLSYVEHCTNDAGSLTKARKILHSITPDLLLPPRFLRRAASAATRFAALSSGSSAVVTIDHRLAAALWATALAGPYVWEALDRARSEIKRTALKVEQRETIRSTAAERLLSSIRTFAARGWSKDEVDLGCAWVEFEFRCALLFDASGVGYGSTQWPKGVAVAPMLLLEDMPDNSTESKREPLRAARENIMTVLQQQSRTTNRANDSDAARRLSTYLAPGGFAQYLLDVEQPHLALMQLKDAPKGDAVLQAIRGRALAAQAAKLSTTPDQSAEALKMFEQAAALKTNLESNRTAIVDAAVAASRNLLNTNAGNPTAALKPLDIAVRLSGREALLDQARAEVFVQQALQLKQNEDLKGSVKKFREALSLSDQQATRSMLAEAVHEQAIAALVEMQTDQALELQRESLRLSNSVEPSRIDYQARCDLQMYLIRSGAEIAGADDAGPIEANLALILGLNARSILDDEDAREFLASAYHEVGRHDAIAKNWDSAISSLEQATSLSSKEGHRKFLARLLLIRGANTYDAGNRYAGKRDINRAHDLDPNEPDIRSVWLRI